MQAFEILHGPVGTDRQDYLVAHMLLWIGHFLHAVKGNVTIETFLPPWAAKAPARPTREALAAKISALPGASGEVPDWAKG